MSRKQNRGRTKKCSRMGEKAATGKVSENQGDSG